MINSPRFIISSLEEAINAAKVDPLGKSDHTKVIFVDALQDIAEYLLREGYQPSDLFDYIDDVRERLEQ